MRCRRACSGRRRKLLRLRPRESKETSNPGRLVEIRLNAKAGRPASMDADTPDELAQRWLAVKDPEGVVFEYPVEDEETAGAAARRPRDRP